VSRYRLVTVQNGREHVSTVVSGRDEIERDLWAEALLHSWSGWKVAVGTGMVVATKGDVVREVFFREYDPMGDI
jgi:hypothetical protein